MRFAFGILATRGCPRSASWRTTTSHSTGCLRCAAGGWALGVLQGNGHASRAAGCGKPGTCGGALACPARQGNTTPGQLWGGCHHPTTRATQAARSVRGRRWQIKSSHHCSGGGQCCLSWVARIAGSGLAFLTTISVIRVTNHVANGWQLHGQTIPHLDLTSSQMQQVRVTCSSSNALWPASMCCVPSSPP